MKEFPAASFLLWDIVFIHSSSFLIVFLSFIFCSLLFFFLNLFCHWFFGPIFIHIHFFFLLAELYLLVTCVCWQISLLDLAMGQRELGFHSLTLLSPFVKYLFVSILVFLPAPPLHLAWLCPLLAGLQRADPAVWEQIASVLQGFWEGNKSPDPLVGEGETCKHKQPQCVLVLPVS